MSPFKQRIVGIAIIVIAVLRKVKIVFLIAMNTALTSLVEDHVKYRKVYINKFKYID